jgi:hypothetical protein
VTDATLVNSGNGAEVTQRLYDYYQRRHSVSTRLYVPVVIPGTEVVVDTLYDQEINGVIEKMKVNLSGGFVADVEITGRTAGD